MKNIFLATLLCLWSLLAMAQEPWQVPNYNNRSSLTIFDGGKHVEVKNGDEKSAFPIVKSGSQFKLKNAADNSKILSLLKLDVAVIEAKYASMGNTLSSAEKLITRASELQGQQLLMVSASGGAMDSVNDIVAEDEEPAGGVEGVQDEAAPSSVNWLYVAGGALLLIIVTAAITKAMTKKSTPVIVEDEKEEQQTVAVKAGKQPAVKAEELKRLKQQVKELQQQYDALMQRNSETEKNLAQFQSFDKDYFNEAFKKLVAPLSNAMESGSQKEIVENALKIATHFSSLTRYKISKRQEHDEANILYLLGKNSNTNTTEITAATPLDKIPKNIKVLMDILKQYQSAGLDESIVSGYKIKNL